MNEYKHDNALKIILENIETWLRHPKSINKPKTYKNKHKYLKTKIDEKTQ